MVEGHRRSDMPWRLDASASATKTGPGLLPAGQRHGTLPHLAFGTLARNRTGRSDKTSRNALEGYTAVLFPAKFTAATDTLLQNETN